MEHCPERVQQLETLIEVAGVINSSLEKAEVRRRAIEASVRLVDVERASLLLLDKKKTEMHFEVALGDGTDALSHVKLVPGQGIAGCVVESGQPLVIHDVQSDPRYFAGLDAKSGFVTRDMICVPVRAKDELLGVLQVMNKCGGTFSDDDLMLTTALADQVGIAIENARLYERLEAAFRETWIYAVISAAAVLGSGVYVYLLGR